MNTTSANSESGLSGGVTPQNGGVGKGIPVTPLDQAVEQLSDLVIRASNVLEDLQQQTIADKLVAAMVRVEQLMYPND